MSETALSSSPQQPQVTLLLAHGGGFCKEIWDPIVRRLQDSPLLQDARTEIVAFDFPFHGSKRDESVAPQVKFLSPKSQRVEHPASEWVYWGPEEVHRQVQQLRRNRGENKHERTKLIGIGHSMGAAALWKTEVKHPGTFDGLILFEPVYGPSDAESSQKADFLVSIALQREAKWPSRETAVAHFENYRNFAAWDRESLAAYLNGVLVQEDEESGDAIVLATHPHIEASLYCGSALFFSDNEIEQPKCNVVWYGGSRSRLFATRYFAPMVEKHPQIYRIAPSMPNASHLMVLESPSESAAKILDELAHFLAPYRKEDDSHEREESPDSL